VAAKSTATTYHAYATWGYEAGREGGLVRATGDGAAKSAAIFLGREVFGIEYFVGCAHAGAQDRPDEFVPPSAQRLGIEFKSIGMPGLEFYDAFERET
jgi:hypothetical protein